MMIFQTEITDWIENQLRDLDGDDDDWEEVMEIWK